MWRDFRQGMILDRDNTRDQNVADAASACHVIDLPLIIPGGIPQ